MTPSATDRFWAKVNKTRTCWLWTGATTGPKHNYGHCWFDRRYQGAHRVSYQLLVGPIPSGLDIDHLCRVRLCVNPAHLEAVTRRENLLRGNTIIARCAAVTHCPRGHEYTPENTGHTSGRNDRWCIVCSRAKGKTPEALAAGRLRSARRRQMKRQEAGL